LVFLGLSHYDAIYGFPFKEIMDHFSCQQALPILALVPMRSSSYCPILATTTTDLVWPWRDLATLIGICGVKAHGSFLVEVSWLVIWLEIEPLLG